MAINTKEPTCLPLQETIVHSNKTPRTIELVILAFLISMLVYRVVLLKDQNHYIMWSLALICESWFTFTWILGICIKWNQCSIKTYPDRLLKRVDEFEFPAVDVFVTTADPILEPSILTMNTVLSLLAVDYPTDKLALYLSDDACSPVTFYSLVETTKFAKLWLPFCKKYNVQVRAPFRYFTSKSTQLEDNSLEFHHEWNMMKNEYDNLCKKMELASNQRPFICDLDSDFVEFCDVNRLDHPAIIKVEEDKNIVGVDGIFKNLAGRDGILKISKRAGRINRFRYRTYLFSLHKLPKRAGRIIFEQGMELNNVFIIKHGDYVTAVVRTQKPGTQIRNLNLISSLTAVVRTQEP